MNILIVEDDKDILSFLKNALKEEGFVVDTENDGLRGLNKALTNDYDLIMLDNILPNLTGPEICREMRKKGKTTRVLVLSVENMADMKAKTLDMGADDYLSKPFSFTELLARLRALLRRPEQSVGGILSVKGLSLDPLKRIVLRLGKKIHLSPKEFALLEYMMRNHGKVVSRTQILEHVWDMNADLFTNTVETHILNIRKKLGVKNGKQLIHTIPGAGYKLF